MLRKVAGSGNQYVLGISILQAGLLAQQRPTTLLKGSKANKVFIMMEYQLFSPTAVLRRENPSSVQAT